MLKALRNIVIGVLVTYLALFAFTKVIRYPEPIAAIKLGLAPASKTPTLMPWHEISQSPTPIALTRGVEVLPEKVRYEGSEIDFQDFLDRTHTNALLIMQR